MEFYTEALSRVEEDDTILPLFTRSMVDISKGLAKMTMDGNFRPSVQVSSSDGSVASSNTNSD